MAMDYLNMDGLDGYKREIAQFIEFVMRNEEMTTEKMVEYLSKRPIDYGSIYSKFMAACILLWLSPDGVRKHSLRPTANTERPFDLLWLAFEQWMSRGIGHYAEVAGELTSFHSNLRWMMIQNRNDEDTIADLDTVSAKVAHMYLTRVSEIARDNFGNFMEEIDVVLTSLDAMSRDTRKATGSAMQDHRPKPPKAKRNIKTKREGITPKRARRPSRKA